MLFRTNMANQSEPSSFFQVPEEDRAFCARIRVLLNFGVGGAIVLMGLIGNSVAYVVLNRGNVRTAPVATFLLRCLALTDNFFLLLWFMNISMRDLFRFVGYNSLAWRYVRLYSYPTLYIAQCATIWLTLVIGAARYIGVCKPYISRRICSLENVKLAVMILYLLVICYNIPRFFEAKIQPVNGTLWLVDTWLGKNKHYQIIYSHVFYYVLTLILPLMFLSVLNVRLTVAYRAVSDRRRRMRGAAFRTQQDDANITLVMIVVVAVFVLCQLPARLVQIIWSYRYKTCDTTKFYVMEISSLLEVLNSSVNFIIYCFLRPQFRKCLTNYFCSSEPLEDMNSGQIISLNEENGGVYQKCDTVCSDMTCSHKDTIVNITHNQSETKTVSTQADIKDQTTLL